MMWGIFAAAALLSLILTRLSIPLARRLGVIDRPSRGIKEHGLPMPCLGGAAVFAAFWTGWILWQFFAEADAGWDAARVDLWSRIFAGSAIILIVGLVDDVRGLGVWTKLGFQTLAALVLMSSGLKISYLSAWGPAGFVLTLAWVLLLMNAFNFMDSMDGHCAGIAAIAGAVFWTVSSILGQPEVASFAAILTGSVVGFLVWNFFPAKTFLGDNGSLLLGYLFAALSVMAVYRSSEYSYSEPIFPLIVFGVPIYDVLSVLAVRGYRKQIFWKGDRNHFAHRLNRIGMSVRASVIFSCMVGLTMGILAILSTQVGTGLGRTMAILNFFALMAIIGWLEYYSATRPAA